MAREAWCALLLVGLACLWAGTGRAAAPGVVYYVAPGGKDTDPGTEALPFATLDRARDAVRGRPEGAGAAVILREGAYAITRTFQLDAADSGAPGTPVIYRAREGETARLVAGRVVAPADFRPVKDAAMLARLDPAARGKVLALDLGKLGVRHAGPFPDVFHGSGGILELYCAGRRMPLARWPNEGYVTMARVLDKGDWSQGPNRRGGTFAYRDDRPRRWSVAEGVWLDGFWRVPWQPETVRVQGIDPERREITFAAPVALGIGSKYAGPEGSGKENYCATNLVDEIDTPGEWAIHFPSKTLYFWPPAPLAEAPVLLADMETPIVSLKGTSHVELRGLVIEGGLGNGVEIEGGSENAVVACTIRNVGGTAVIVRDGRNNGVRACEIHDVGEGGVYLGGGDRKTLTPCGNYAVNNHIHHFGEVKKTYAPGIGVGAYEAGTAVGCRVAHNLIHDAPHAAVLYGGNDNLFEYNEVHHIALDSGDVGAFYTWNDWTSRGNVVRRNFIHHSPAANGVYMDDGDSGDLVEGNVFYRMASGAFIGGGHDNIVRGNLFIECAKAVHVDARGAARGYAMNRRMIDAVKAMNPGEPPWSTRYPELAALLESHPELPSGDVIERNVAVRCPKWLNRSGTEEQLRGVKVGVNLILDDEDPGFLEPDRLDFRFRPGSPVLRRLPDWQSIPLEQVGLVVDADRPRLPAQGPRALDAGGRPAGEIFDSETDLKRSNETGH